MISVDSNSYLINDIKYTRVTQITNLYPKPWLIPWYRKSHNTLCHAPDKVLKTSAASTTFEKTCGFDANDEKGKASMAFGTKVHHRILVASLDQMIVSETHPEKERIRVCLDRYYAWREEYGVQRVLPEDTAEWGTLVKSDSLKIAGRFDELDKIKGDKTCLTEYKTGENASGAHEIQIGFYSRLLREDKKINLDKACIFYLEIPLIKWYNSRQLVELENIALNYYDMYRHYKAYEKGKNKA